MTDAELARRVATLDLGRCESRAEAVLNDPAAGVRTVCTLMAQVLYFGKVTPILVDPFVRQAVLHKLPDILAVAMQFTPDRRVFRRLGSWSTGDVRRLVRQISVLPREIRHLRGIPRRMMEEVTLCDMGYVPQQIRSLCIWPGGAVALLRTRHIRRTDELRQMVIGAGAGLDPDALGLIAADRALPIDLRRKVYREGLQAVPKSVLRWLADPRHYSRRIKVAAGVLQREDLVPLLLHSDAELRLDALFVAPFLS